MMKLPMTPGGEPSVAGVVSFPPFRTNTSGSRTISPWGYNSIRLLGGGCLKLRLSMFGSNFFLYNEPRIEERFASTIKMLYNFLQWESEKRLTRLTPSVLFFSSQVCKFLVFEAIF